MPLTSYRATPLPITTFINGKQVAQLVALGEWVWKLTKIILMHTLATTLIFTTSRIKPAAKNVNVAALGGFCQRIVPGFRTLETDSKTSCSYAMSL